MTTDDYPDVIAPKVTTFFQLASAAHPLSEEAKQVWNELMASLIEDGHLNLDRAFVLWYTVARCAGAIAQKFAEAQVGPIDDPEAYFAIAYARDNEVVDADDVPAHVRLTGRFITAAFNDDVETAAALWATVPDRATLSTLGQTIRHHAVSAARTFVATGGTL